MQAKYQMLLLEVKQEAEILRRMAEHERRCTLKSDLMQGWSSGAESAYNITADALDRIVKMYEGEPNDQSSFVSEEG